MALLGRKSPKDKFAAEVAKAARSQLGARVVVRDDFALGITAPGHSELVLFLDNLWGETQRMTSAAERAARIGAAIRAAVPVPGPKTWAEARRVVLPAVRALSWTAAAADMGATAPVARPLQPFLSLGTAVDSEFAIAYVTAGDLTAWGVTQPEVEAQARLNLAGQAVPFERERGRYVVTGPDGYASSWLACPERLAQLADDLPSPLVLATSRDDVTVVSAADPDLAGVLRAASTAYQEHPRRISPVPYALTAAGLAPWAPPVDHPCADLVGRAVAILELVEYTDQQNRLNARFEADGTDTYVASYTLMEGPGESVWSWSSWARGVTSGLLPKTTYVGLVDLEGAERDGFIVAWDDVMALAADALRLEPGLDPPRWAHVSWPGEAAVAALRDRAVRPPGDD